MADKGALSKLAALTAILLFVIGAGHSSWAAGTPWTVRATWESFSIGSNGGDQNLGQGDGIYTGSSRTSVVGDVAHSGTKSLRIFLPGGLENTYQTEFRLPSKITEGGEIWGRFYLYVPGDFDWTANPITKLFRYAVNDSSGGGIGYISILATRPGNYGCPGSPNNHGYIVGGAEFNSAFQFVCQNVTPQLHFLTPGLWHALELYVKVSSSGSGIYRVWHNGELIWQHTGISNIPAGGAIAAMVGSSGSYANHLLGWWNGGVPKDQYLYFDDLEYTNTTPAQRDARGNPMIGLTNGKAVLAAPNILSVL